MISIVMELIDPVTQGAIWGTAAYLGSKAGEEDKPKSLTQQRLKRKKHLIQAGIGAGAGASGAIGASGIAQGLKKAKEAVTD